MTPTEPGPNDLLTTRELMEYLQVSRTKVWELVTKQGLPAFKLGGDYRYRRREVDEWLEKHRTASDAKPKPKK
ncbi:MAG TPA: AlpA family transcriptional regulator [Planctomycetaceae bacterium]|jgi:excisionase family DNA binding protein|nr:AlpA family transcriptional regulator [Planctomycetaceae bacterium]